MSSIFGNEPEKSDFEKIGVQTIRPFCVNGRWMFRKDNKTYDMAPAGVVDVALSPIVLGADRLIRVGCQMKGIQNPDKGFLLLFSTEYFPGADVKFNLGEQMLGGWVYTVEELNLTGLLPGQSAWVCPYLTLYYNEPPKTLYLKMEADPDGNSQ